MILERYETINENGKEFIRSRKSAHLAKGVVIDSSYVRKVAFNLGVEPSAVAKLWDMEYDGLSDKICAQASFPKKMRLDDPVSSKVKDEDKFEEEVKEVIKIVPAPLLEEVIEEIIPQKVELSGELLAAAKQFANTYEDNSLTPKLNKPKLLSLYLRTKEVSIDDIAKLPIELIRYSSSSTIETFLGSLQKSYGLKVNPSSVDCLKSLYDKIIAK